MTDREYALRNLRPSDIVQARFTEWPGEGDGPGLTSLITAIDDETLTARTIFTQVTFTFDRKTGRSKTHYDEVYFSKTQELRGQQTYDEGLVAAIISVAHLPADIYAVMLQLDRKHRLAPFGTDPDRRKLTADERRVMSFIGDYYAKNPI